MDRIRPLYEQNAASQLDLDNAVAAYETAVASVGMSQADLDQAEQELGYTIVRSPISGHISERHVDLGTLVGTGGKSLLATIVKSDTVLVDFSMTALDYLKSKERNVNIGQTDQNRSWQPTVTITLPDNSVYPYKGLVDFAEPQVDPRTGTFSVRAEMPNPEHVLLPGQFTKVKALLDVREQATVVPQKALIIEKGRSLRIRHAQRLHRGTALHRAGTGIREQRGGGTRTGSTGTDCHGRLPQTESGHEGAAGERDDSRRE